MDNRRGIVEGCHLFASASSRSLDRLAACATVQTPTPDSALFSAGDPSGGLWIVLSGIVRIWINDPRGREHTMMLLEPGDVLGEIALLDGGPRSANADVMGPTRLLHFPREGFRAILREDPDLAEHVIIMLCEKLRGNTEDLHRTAFYDLGARLALKLIDLAVAHAKSTGDGFVFTRKFSQTELALMLGASREAVNKRMSKLVAAEVLKVEDGYIHILDHERLKRAAHAA